MLTSTLVAVFLPLFGIPHVRGEDVTPEQARNRNRTMSVGFVIFEGFQPLDVYGPLTLFYEMSYNYPMKLALISHKTGPVSTITPPHSMEPGMPPMDLSFMLGPQTVATHTFATAPPLDILLMPGGLGTLAISQTGDRSIETFLRDRFNTTEYVLSVCNGAASLARAGVLDGRRATTNKALYSFFTTAFSRELGTAGNITWVPSARWVEDGKVWTSSGVSSGIDMTYAFFKKIYGAETTNGIVNNIEYAPHGDSHWDPFSVYHKVPGADTSRSLVDCAGPAGVKV